MVLTVNSDNPLIFVMVKCDVLFEVRTEFLNTIQTRVGFKGLKLIILYFCAGKPRHKNCVNKYCTMM
jgi:hypothetical protein